MIRFIVTVGVFLLCHSIAIAEPIAVRSGEHRNFTRLVMPLPNGSDWSLKNETGVSKLAVSNFDDGFDLTSAFAIIPRTRLRALVARGGELELQLTCECRVNAFLERDEFIVIDIFDGPPIKQSITEPVEFSALPGTRFSYGDLLWNRPENEITGPSIDGRQAFSDPERNIMSDDQPTVDSEQIVTETREQLLRAFTNAASNGIVQTNIEDIDRLSPSQSQDSGLAIFDSSETVQPATVPPAAQIRITNSKDVPDQNTTPVLNLEGAVCPSSSIVNVAAWGEGSNIGSQIADSNSVLFDELGRISEQAALERAKLYVYFGFGAEALQTLNLVSGLTEENPHLVDLSNIMEHGYAKNPRSLHRFTNCPSELALWAILTAKEIAPSQAIDASAAVLALRALPPHLKNFLGKGLADRLLAFGDLENASIAIRSFESLDQRDHETSSMAHAKAAKLRNNPEQSSKIIEDIVTKNTAEAPQALVAAINESIRKGAMIDAETALLAESYAFEYRNSDLGPEMLRSFILAAAKSGQFSKALDVIADQDRMSNLAKETVSEVSSFVFSELAQIASDAEFISSFFGDFEAAQENIDPATTVEVASRMLEMGFADNALTLVDELPTGFQSPQLSMLRAETLVVSGHFEQALSQISEVDDNKAAELRAEILEKMGNSKDAARYYNDADMPERAASAIWLSEDWATLVPEEEPIFGPITELSNAINLEIDVDQNMLSRSEEAIEASENARLALQNTLSNLKTSE